jgi:isoquinoline 1-oxidoreductase alpha subunit
MEGCSVLEFEVNGQTHKVDVPDDVPLLWILREELGLTGTKFGCGKGLCGACTIHLNGQPTRCCILPGVAVAGQKITTIEGVAAAGKHAVQEAWIKHSVPQCGYCQSGQIMAAVGHLNQVTTTDKATLLGSVAANICRCGTYHKIEEALVDAAKSLGKLQEP